MRLNIRLLLLISLLSLTTACGFQLRGLSAVSFDSIYLQGATLSISKGLRDNLNANHIKILSSAEGADVLLELLSEANDKRILSLSGGGVVREYELFYRVHYRIRGSHDALWSAPQTIESRRDYSYTDAALLAKQEEETRLYENMRSDVLNNLLRKISRYKPDSGTNSDATLRDKTN